MNIYYKNNTLYVEVYVNISNELIKIIERKVFLIIDDYNINNIKILHNNNILNNEFKELVDNYYEKYNGKLEILNNY